MKNKKKLGLTTLIFIALIAGAITGIIINYCIPVLYNGEKAFRDPK